MKTIRIIGGGLAGLSLGICLRRHGIPVDLYEKGSYPRHKVCGEFISGITDETLDSLGIRHLVDDALRHHKINWCMGSDSLLTETLPFPALGISRYLLDQRMADEFQRLGGNLKTGQRITDSNLLEDGAVWASGKKTNSTQQSPDWIGLKIHATDTQLDGLQMHSGTSTRRGGYIGLCQVESHRVNCCGLFHVRPDIRPSTARKQWNSPAALIMAYAEACGMTRLLEMLQSWEYDATSFTATAGFSLGHQQPDHSFSIGDAAWLIPPFTGNGMSMAMESSALAAPWLRQYAEAKLAWKDATHGYLHATKNHFSRRMKLSRAMHPLLFHYAGQQALKASSKAGLLPFQSLFRQLRTP